MRYPPTSTSSPGGGYFDPSRARVTTVTRAATSSSADPAQITQPNSFTSPTCAQADRRAHAKSTSPTAPTHTAIKTPPQVWANSG